MGLDYAVVTMVARDDLADGGVNKSLTLLQLYKTNPSTSIKA